MAKCFRRNSLEGDLFGLIVSDVSWHPEVSVLGVRRVMWKGELHTLVARKQREGNKKGPRVPCP